MERAPGYKRLEKKSELVDLSVIVHYETQKAWLISDGCSDQKVWIPKSHGEMQNLKNDPGTGKPIGELTIPSWLAIEKGLV